MLFGVHAPVYVVFLKGFEDIVETDEEFSMHTRHELRHVEDAYNGITLENFRITGNMPEVGVDFITNIGELRATHDTAMHIYKAFKSNGALTVPSSYFASEANRYASYWKLVKTGGTATERMLADLQLAEFSDITPEELLSDGAIKVTFNASGEKDSFVIKRING